VEEGGLLFNIFQTIYNYCRKHNKQTDVSTKASKKVNEDDIDPVSVTTNSATRVALMLL